MSRRAEAGGGQWPPGAKAGSAGLSAGVSPPPDSTPVREVAARALEIEATAINDLIGRLDTRFDRAVELILGGGHEVAHHGYLHEKPNQLGRDREREYLRRAPDAPDAARVGEYVRELER